ncbi:MAG: family 43 glycosylhydrolase, partial [Armatimonadetes bacterium]|nr:family 43 glycosylhydrolase [Armatimonadota bacterium]
YGRGVAGRCRRYVRKRHRNGDLCLHGTEGVRLVLPDLVNWTNEGMILKFKDPNWVDKNAWAPCIAERNGKYYFYYSADSRIGVAVGDSPAGPFKDPLGQPLVPYKEDISVIDPMTFIDDSGRGVSLLRGGPGFMAEGQGGEDLHPSLRAGAEGGHDHPRRAGDPHSGHSDDGRRDVRAAYRRIIRAEAQGYLLPDVEPGELGRHRRQERLSCELRHLEVSPRALDEAGGTGDLHPSGRGHPRPRPPLGGEPPRHGRVAHRVPYSQGRQGEAGVHRPAGVQRGRDNQKRHPDSGRGRSRPGDAGGDGERRRSVQGR